MVRIQGGKFVMGIAVADSRDSLAQQAVEVREFFLDKTATTNAQFRAFRKATSYQTESQSFGWSFVLELYATEEAKVSSALGLELGPPSALPSRSPSPSPSPPASRVPQGDHQLVGQGCVPLVGGARRQLALAAWPRLRHQRPPLAPGGARLVERRQGLLQVGGQAVSSPAARALRAREAAALCTRGGHPRAWQVADRDRVGIRRAPPAHWLGGDAEALPVGRRGAEQRDRVAPQPVAGRLPQDRRRARRPRRPCAGRSPSSPP